MNSVLILVSGIAVALLSGYNGQVDQTAAPEAAPARGTSTARVAAPEKVQGTQYPESVYWGDQHVHTSYSGDAAAAGTTVGPEGAVRFARGETISPTPARMRSCTARWIGWLSPITPMAWA